MLPAAEHTRDVPDLLHAGSAACRPASPAPPSLPVRAGVYASNPLFAVNATGTHRIGPVNRRPQNVTEVLCRELGAGHPDGALRQIRTMKRVLRTHYQAQKRLERFGVDSSMEAAGRLADLREQLAEEREVRRRQAQANVDTLDAALDVLRDARKRLDNLARAPAPASNTLASNNNATETASSQTSSGPARAAKGDTDRVAALDAFDTVTNQLDELRLELWVEAGEPDPDESDAADGVSCLLDRLQADMARLSSENRRLHREVSHLRRQQAELSNLLSTYANDRAE